MRRIFLTLATTIGLGLALSATVVSAADMPVKAPIVVPPAFSWTGFYIGANVGGGWNRDRGNHFCVNPGGVVNAPDCQRLPDGTDANTRGSGLLGGVQLGYNWQTGRTVFGVEVDWQLSDLSGSTTVNGPFPFFGFPGFALPAGVMTASQKVDWFGTVRGRLGYAAWDRGMIYVTGGLIYANIDAKSLFTAPNVSTVYAGSVSTTRTGWTIGGGVEYAFTNTLSGKLEALYFDLDSFAVIGRETPLTFPYQHNKTFDNTGVIVRAGLNFRFAGDRIN